MKKIKKRVLRHYVTADGVMPFQEWLDGLKDPTIRMRVRRRLDRVSLGNFGDHKSLGGGVSELRLTFGSGYRVYYAEYEDVVIIILLWVETNVVSEKI